MRLFDRDEMRARVRGEWGGERGMEGREGGEGGRMGVVGGSEGEK